jgi:two-component system chemotaxis response regulator CheB
MTNNRNNRTLSAGEHRAINVLIVDDSAVMRQVVSGLLAAERDISVSAASDPIIAMQKMRSSRPDVILLDIEMPRMDGMTFLQKIMREDPVPVVICSGHAARGARLGISALEAGAIDIITKPELGVKEFLHQSAALFLQAVRGAAIAKPRASRVPGPPIAGLTRARAALPARNAQGLQRIVVIGASTGGPGALHELLRALPEDAPPIVIAQHMPQRFTGAFARSLDAGCSLTVKEAEGGERLARGLVLVAPGSKHAAVVNRGGGYAVELGSEPAGCRPSVDVLFRSAVRAAGANAIGVLLTGMGTDGARGLLELKKAGAVTIAEDETSAVVFGMPREAIAMGAACQVLPLHEIAPAILALRDRAGPGSGSSVASRQP